MSRGWRGSSRRSTPRRRIRYIGEDGQPLDEATTTRLNEIRRAAGIDAAQQATHEEMVATGNGATWIVPVVRRHEEGGQFLGVKALSVPVYCQAVEVADRRAPPTGQGPGLRLHRPRLGDVSAGLRQWIGEGMTTEQAGEARGLARAIEAARGDVTLARSAACGTEG